MKINVCVATLKRYDLLKKEIESLEKGTVKPDMYYIIDNGMKMHTDFLPENCIVFTPKKQMALSACWNMFMKNDGYNFIINDDLEFGETTIEDIKNALEKDTSNVFDFFSIVNKEGYQSGYSAFILDQHSYNEIGMFDENFYPAYYEDCDYSRRFNLLNKKELHIHTDFIHLGSSTLNSYTPEERAEFDKMFVKNRDYYITKWGGEPHKETFITPFNK